MIDTFVRPLINPPLNAAARALVRWGIGANAVTAVGLAVGVAAALSIVAGWFALAFVLILVNRIVDGLDGAVARASVSTDLGGYFDIASDYLFYVSVPLAFAVIDPPANALPAAALLGGFCLTATSFLGFAIVAAKRGLTTQAHGKKSFFYSTGLVEGTETVVFFLLMCALPHAFAKLAWLFAGLCALTAVQRAVLAAKVFRHES